MNLEISYFECQCQDPEHTLRFCYDPSDGELWMEAYVSSNYLGFFRRLWRGIKYVFGANSKYGHFDTTMFRPEDIIRLQELLEKVKVHGREVNTEQYKFLPRVLSTHHSDDPV